MDKEIQDILAGASSERRNLVESEAKSICKYMEMCVPTFEMALCACDAVNSACTMGFPVVMKVISSSIIHKTDVGGVILNIRDEKEVAYVFDKLRELALTHGGKENFHGVLVEKMQPPGVEMIVGMYRDPQFGPVVMVGLGGIFVEVMKDVSYRLAPLDEFDVEEMIQELRGSKILEGVRGKGPLDIQALSHVIRQVAGLAVKYKEIKEIDLNPILVYEKNAVVVDARMIL